MRLQEHLESDERLIRWIPITDHVRAGEGDGPGDGRGGVWRRLLFHPAGPPSTAVRVVRAVRVVTLTTSSGVLTLNTFTADPHHPHGCPASTTISFCRSSYLCWDRGTSKQDCCPATTFLLPSHIPLGRVLVRAELAGRGKRCLASTTISSSSPPPPWKQPRGKS